MPSTPPKDHGVWPAPGFTTIKAYAEKVGLSTIAIQKKISLGKLDGCWYKDGLNRYHLDEEACDEALKFKSSREMRNQKTSKEGYKDIEGEDLDAGVKATNAFNRAKSAHEVIKLQKAQIELAELKGSLVSMDEVRKEQFLLARLLRDQLMSFPDRISALLTSMTDERKIHTLITAEIRNCLKVVDEKAREEIIKNA